MGPAGAAGGGGDEEPVDVPGALGGVLVSETYEKSILICISLCIPTCILI